MHKGLHKRSTLAFLTDWISLWPGPAQLLIALPALRPERAPLLLGVVGAQGALPHAPPSPPAGVMMLQHSLPPHSPPPQDKAGERAGTWAALSNLAVAEVQNENGPSRRARRYWCQMSEESRVCHIERVALEKPAAWGSGGQQARRAAGTFEVPGRGRGTSPLSVLGDGAIM